MNIHSVASPESIFHAHLSFSHHHPLREFESGLCHGELGTHEHTCSFWYG